MDSSYRAQHNRCRLPPLLIGLAKQKGVVGYPGDGANLWPAVHARDLASLFRRALEKGPPGKNWHGIEGEGLPCREIAESTGSHLELPAVSPTCLDRFLSE